MIKSLLIITVVAVGCTTANEAIHKEACGENVAIATINDLNVEGCSTSPCLLHRGSNTQLNVTFTPKQVVEQLTARVFGIVQNLAIPYNVPQKDACENSGLSCPLAADEQVTYTAVLPVEVYYPLIQVPVKWELVDEKDNVVFCTEILAKIVRANHKKDH